MERVKQPSNEESDLFKIVVATDCHLGFMEKDEIRRDDSFNAFEEICKIAQENHADFVLLGGDLFHENKPSRTTLVRTIEILRRYCLNDNPVKFQVVSDQTVNFPNMFGKVNYEDPHFNVGLPFFTIHGNHDDPAGVDNLSAIDILSACNLVNYFGKMSLKGNGVGQVSLHPILLQKGNSRIALYGLGNIRDERLNRMFQVPIDHIVVQEIQILHDNVQPFYVYFHFSTLKDSPCNTMGKARASGGYWAFRLVQHFCPSSEQEVAGMGFHLSQPGSSVATSLIEGESKQKHVLLLEIKGNQYRPTKIPLTSVRPFEYREVSLRDLSDIDPSDQSAVLKALDQQAKEMIEEAARKRDPNRPSLLPLIRIRVDYTGYSTVNPQKFGQKYVGKVANPHDMLLFSKASAKRRMSTQGENVESENLRPEELNQQNIESLLSESNLRMEILPVQTLGLALHDFVNKDDKMAFHTCVKSSLEETQSILLKEGIPASAKEDTQLKQRMSQIMKRRESDVLQSRDNVENASNEIPGASMRDMAEDDDLNMDGVSIGDDKANISAPNENFEFDAGEDPRFTKVSSRGGSQVQTPASTQGNGTRGRRGGRGRGRGDSATSKQVLKQTTLKLGPRERPTRRAAAAAASTRLQSTVGEDDEIASDSDPEASKELEQEEEDDSEEMEGSISYKRGRGRKRNVPSLAPTHSEAFSSAKRGRLGNDSSNAKKGFLADDVEDDEDEMSVGRRRGTATQSTRKESQSLRKWGSLRK